VLSGSFETTRFKSKPKPAKLKEVHLVGLGDGSAAAEAVKAGAAVAAGNFLTRWVVVDNAWEGGSVLLVREGECHPLCVTRGGRGQCDGASTPAGAPVHGGLGEAYAGAAAVKAGAAMVVGNFLTRRVVFLEW
jgi:hypothetical protein